MRAASGIPLFLLLSCAAASAQAVNTAQINGTVRDQSGAALPGVTIAVTQTDTDLTRTARRPLAATAISRTTASLARAVSTSTWA